MKKLKPILKTFLIVLTVILITGLILFVYKIKKYKNIENDYINAARIIYENNAIENAANIDIIILNRQEINVLFTTAPLSIDCNGYVVIKSSNQGPDIKAYIKCADKYKSPKFEEKYLK